MAAREPRAGRPEGSLGHGILRDAASAGSVRIRGSIADLPNQWFGGLIEVTSGPGIFVERALHSDAQGVVFAAGTNALATRLP
jgi:hypothetical protein